MKKWCVCGSRGGFYWMTYGKISRETQKVVKIHDECTKESATWDKEASDIRRFDTIEEAKKLYDQECRL